jgi:hypothetical protein
MSSHEASVPHKNLIRIIPAQSVRSAGHKYQPTELVGAACRCLCHLIFSTKAKKTANSIHAHGHAHGPLYLRHATDVSRLGVHRTRTGRGQPTENIWRSGPLAIPSPRTMAAVAQAAPVVAAAAAHTIYLPAACRGISPRAANGTTTGAFRWRPRRRTLARARPARRGGRATGRARDVRGRIRRRAQGT